MRQASCCFFNVNQAVGQQSYFAYSDGASVSGQDISVMHGGGKYAGYDLLHYGGGSPKLDGRSLTLFGYHDGGEVVVIKYCLGQCVRDIKYQ